jgi:hypothetical protein
VIIAAMLAHPELSRRVAPLKKRERAFLELERETEGTEEWLGFPSTIARGHVKVYLE